MSGVSRKSLASWPEMHGFGILCIVSPEGERFLVGPDESQVAAGANEHDPPTMARAVDVGLWRHRSMAAELRQTLKWSAPGYVTERVVHEHNSRYASHPPLRIFTVDSCQ